MIYIVRREVKIIPLPVYVPRIARLSFEAFRSFRTMLRRLYRLVVFWVNNQSRSPAFSTKIQFAQCEWLVILEYGINPLRLDALDGVLATLV